MRIQRQSLLQQQGRAYRYLQVIRHISFDEILASIEEVSASDVLRIAQDLFRDSEIVASVVGPRRGGRLSPDRLRLNQGALKA